MFSGLVWVGTLRSFGSSSFTLWVITGVVMRKMINSTYMMSTRGVVLIDATIASSASSAAPTVIDMAAYRLADSSTLCTSPEKARIRSITCLLRRINQL